MITELISVVETQYEFTQKKKMQASVNLTEKEEYFSWLHSYLQHKNKAMKMQVVIADRNPLRAMEGWFLGVHS